MRPPTLLLVLLCATAPRGALAQTPVDDATRSSARQLGEEANALFDAGDWAGALDKYERADALVHVPTLGLRAARCLVKLGRLVQASERYLATSRMTLAPDALPVHREAVEAAQTEREALLPRIPAVVVSVEPAGAADVTIDGTPLPPALLGARRLVNPGSHEVVARRGAAAASKTVSVAEGQVAAVALRLEGGGAVGSATPPPASKHSDEPRAGSTQRTLSWIALGVGAAGVAVGGITAGLAIGKKGELEDAGCGSDLKRCPESVDFGGYNTLRVVSGIGLIAGGVVAATGVVLLVTAPSRAERTGITALGATPGGVWIAGAL